MLPCLVNNCVCRKWPIPALVGTALVLCWPSFCNLYKIHPMSEWPRHTRNINNDFHMSCVVTGPAVVSSD